MTPAPPQLAQMGLDPATFTRADARSFRGSCPRCGGSRRCHVWTDQPWPHWRVECDGCGLKAWADDLQPALRQPVSDEQRRAWQARNDAERAHREKQRQRIMAQFSTAEVWETYRERMTALHREHWRARGIPDALQDFWRLGFDPDKCYRCGADLHHSPALTIPYFHTGRVFQTMQYRLLEPQNPADKYRFEHGLSRAYYDTNPDEPLTDEVVVCEGAIKAMVCAIRGEFSDNVSVLAVSSKNTALDVVPAVKDCGRVWIVLDPDAELWARRLAQAVGKAARVVTLPCKADDFFTLHGGTASDFRGWMSRAGRC